MDRMPNEGELIEVDEPAHQVGGCASNTAIALSKLGKKRESSEWLVPMPSVINLLDCL